MVWRESINRRLRETFQVFYDLNQPEHNLYQVKTLLQLATLYNINPANFNEFMTSQVGKKAQEIFGDEISPKTPKNAINDVDAFAKETAVYLKRRIDQEGIKYKEKSA